MREDFFSIVKSRVGYKGFKPKNNPVNIPANLLVHCPKCQKTMLREEISANNKVCPSCNYHMRLSAKERLTITVDKGSFIEYDAHMKTLNPINFPEYEEKIKLLQEKTNLQEAVITGECQIRGSRCAIGIMDSRFMMASMGSVVGEKITRLFETATKKRLPVVLFSASGGARMQEGMFSLIQMAKTSAAVGRHHEKGLLFINVFTDPTTGGVTASFASLGDILLAEPKVLIGFAGRRVIENTIRQKLPDDFQSAEFMMQHGFLDRIVERKYMRKELASLLKLHETEGKPIWVK